MSGLFGSFNVAVKGLNTSATALHTTGHNISNANTEGFNRQRVNMKADNPYNLSGVGQLGTGVRIDSVVRVMDEFVDIQIRNDNSIMARYETEYDTIGQIEMVFNEPSDTGLNFAMGEMFDSWQELSKGPESLSMASLVIDKSKTFTDTLNHMANKAEQLKSDVVSNVSKNVFDANSLISQLNTVNEQVANIQMQGHSANDLMDVRDQLIKEISGIADIKTNFDKWGRAEVQLGGAVVTGRGNTSVISSISAVAEQEDGTFNVEILVGGDFTTPRSFNVSAEELGGMKAGMAVFYNEPKLDEELSEHVRPALITSGSIGGYTNSIKEIEARVADLDKIAGGMKHMFNSMHNPDGDGVDFFKGDNAGMFTVTNELLMDEGLLRAGKNVDSPDGDGSRALAIANLRTTKFNFKAENVAEANVYNDTTMKFETNGVGNTLEGAYREVVIKVGIQTERASNMVDNQKSVLTQLYNRRESVSGVSIDEEVTNMLKFQRSYEANSRVINTINDMLDTLINRTGV